MCGCMLFYMVVYFRLPARRYSHLPCHIIKSRYHFDGTMLADKTPADLALYLRLLACVKPYWRVFAIAVLAMTVLALTNPAIAALFKRITEGVFFNSEAGLVAEVIVPVLLVFVIAALSAYISRVALAWVGEKIVMDLRVKMFDRLLLLPCSSMDEHTSGSLVSKFTFDVAQLKEAGTSVITTLIRDALSVLGLIAWMLYLNWLMTVIALLAAPFVMLILLIIRNRLRRMSRLIQDSMAQLNHVLTEAISGHRVIKIFAARDEENNIFGQKANANRRFNMKFTNAAAITTPAINIMTACILVALILVAIQQGSAGNITVAEFNSFFIALLMLLSPVRRLSQVNEHLQRGLAASESVFAFIDQEIETDAPAVAIEKLGGAIEINALDFSYHQDAGPVLHNISLQIEPGQTAAIIGPSGSGKSSLVNLLPRFYDYTHGDILIGGESIRALSLAQLRASIALVSQEVMLFNNTVRNNIAYGGNRHASMEAIRHAARLANALEFIEALDGGFDTVIGRDGSRLSGGQRQRIALARAFLKDAPILIMDEATSALDSESEKAIQHAMETLRHKRTCIIIAHRLSTIEMADIVFVLEHGRLVEEGRHSELIKRDGTYTRLYNNSASGFID